MKRIVIDAAKCTGCRACEVACSLSHSKGHINPRGSRVRVYRDDVEGIFAPIIAGPRTLVEYVDEPKVVVGGKGADISPVWALFRDPSRACNGCGVCADWCVTGALTSRGLTV